FPQHVGHADVREDRVVPARGGGAVAVVGAQVGVQPVGAATGPGGPRAGDHGEVGRHGAEPFLGIGRTHGDGHRVADLLGGEQQVRLDLVVVEADVLQPVVAHGRGAVAAQAVVHE